VNLVFLYSSRGRIPIDKPDKLNGKTMPEVDYVNNKPTTSFLNGTLSDLYPYIWEKLINNKIFDKITTLFEVRDGWGSVEVSPNNKVVFIPHISEVHKFVEPGDIIFVRGAWKWWQDHIRKLSKNHNLVYYRGGRVVFKNWWWHIIIDDIYLKNAVDRYKRTNIYYPKCINEEIFYYKPKAEKKYDLILVGEIKESKGQYKVILALNEYRKLYGKNLKVCVVGKAKDVVRFRHFRKRFKIAVDYRGKVSREELNNLYNASKLYIHLGTNEQGPRTTLEAIRCGLPCLISSMTHMWPEWVVNSNFCKNVSSRDFEQIAKTIHEMLNTDYNGLQISRVYNKYSCSKLTVRMWRKIKKAVEDNPRRKPHKSTFTNAFKVTDRRS